MMCQRIGFSPISIIGFGFKWLSSLIRVPNPPANITTFIALLLLSIVFIEIYSNGFLPKFSSHPALHPGRYAGRFPDPHRSPSGNSVPAPLIPVNMLSFSILRHPVIIANLSVLLSFTVCIRLFITSNISL